MERLIVSAGRQSELQRTLNTDKLQQREDRDITISSIDQVLLEFGITIWFGSPSSGLPVSFHFTPSIGRDPCGQPRPADYNS